MHTCWHVLLGAGSERESMFLGRSWVLEWQWNVSEDRLIDKPPNFDLCGGTDYGRLTTHARCAIGELGGDNTLASGSSRYAPDTRGRHQGYHVPETVAVEAARQYKPSLLCGQSPIDPSFVHLHFFHVNKLISIDELRGA